MSVPDEGYSERTWWRLFWAYLMKVILSVPDEGYFERNWRRLFWAYLMKVILSVTEEGYFERTWWRLFWAYLMKVILSVPDEDYLERTWWRLFGAYLMKIIWSVPDEGYSRITPCPLNYICVFIFWVFYCPFGIFWRLFIHIISGLNEKDIPHYRNNFKIIGSYKYCWPNI